MTFDDELRAAARVLRCEHRYPVQVISDAELDRLVGTGRPLADCLKCGSREDGQLAAEPLRGTLAAWLEITADVMTWLGPPEVRPNKDGIGINDAMGTPRIEWDRALDVARSIAGTSPEDGSE